MTRPTGSRPLAHIGPYDLMAKVGSGGMGSVYRARDRRDGHIVALKLMHEHVASDPSYAERFRREAAVAALIDSPNVVRVLEFASDGGRPYIVTEFVEGPAVDDLLREGPLPWDQAAAIVAGVANALAQAARRGVVHRDIKPGNILIAPGGAPKVTDFGIATLNHSSALTMPGVFIGTAAYAAPEQHRGETDVRSDLYSLGVVLFEMLAGSLPFQAETATGMMRKHEEAPVPLERLAGQPPAIVAAVQKCLEKAPERRFQEPRELVAALLGASTSPPAVTVVPSPAPALSPAVPGPEVTFMAPSPDPSATRVDGAAFATGSYPLAAAGTPLWRRHVDEMPVLRKAGIAAGAVACVTLLAMFGFRGSSAENRPASNGGGGAGGHVITVPTDEAEPSTTPEPASPTTTRPPKETATTTPTVPVSTPTAQPTSTPAPKSPTSPPAPRTATPAPAPALSVVDFAFCHASGCPYGQQDLYTGYAIGVAFQLSQATALPVAAEVWFNGVYYYTSTFTASASGLYVDVLPHANEPGDLELEIYVGGTHVGTLWAEVW